MSATIDQLGLDFTAAQQAAQRGMARALPDEEDAWRLRYERAVCDLAASGREFISDDLRAIAGDPPAWVHPNAAGAIVSRLAKLGVIRCVGYGRSARVVGHSNVVRRWVGV